MGENQIRRDELDSLLTKTGQWHHLNGGGYGEVGDRGTFPSLRGRGDAALGPFAGAFAISREIAEDGFGARVDVKFLIDAFQMAGNRVIAQADLIRD